jgi:uncharacterized protein
LNEQKSHIPPIRNLIFVNTLIGGIVGAAVGSLDIFLPWLIGGLVAGALYGWICELVFGKLIELKILYARRMLIMVLSEVLLILFVLIPLYRAFLITHPMRSPVLATPSDFGQIYESITLTASNGVQLAGWYIPSRNRAAIIALHGANGNRAQTLRHAAVLAQHGYGVLMFDLRAHGESGGGYFPAADDSADVMAAVSFLQARPEVDSQKIGGIGLSLGAMVIIQGAARTQAIRALISDGDDASTVDDYIPLPPQYQMLGIILPHLWMTQWFIELYSGAPSRTMKELVLEIAPRPILFISTGQEDEQYFNRRFFEQAGPTAQLWELPDTGHVAGITTHPEEYSRRMLEFFDAHLLGAAGRTP